MRPARPRAVELCAGSAGLTRGLTERGFDAFGVDLIRNRHPALAVVPRFDLTDQLGQQAVRQLLADEPPVYLHAGPPCGTMSRAREKPVPQALQRLGAPNPQPLRSNEHPCGLPTLEGLDLLKVTLANRLSDFVADVVLSVYHRKAYFTIENPLNSYLWMRPAYVSLARLPGVRFVRFQACMHGGA